MNSGTKYNVAITIYGYRSMEAITPATIAKAMIVQHPRRRIEIAAPEIVQDALE